jgi:glyoxylase-like metal-dependent hydrolase (beta-lactamase superfamily II)
LTVVTESEKHARLSYSPTGYPYMEFHDIGQYIDHKQAYGRVAFSIPTNDLGALEKEVLEKGFVVQTPLVVLPTPGKADVSVVILADPDGHEICFVGAEAFWELSVPTGDTIDWELRKENGDRIDVDPSVLKC